MLKGSGNCYFKYQVYPHFEWKMSAALAYSNPSASVPTDIWSEIINSLASKVIGRVEPQTLLAVTFLEMRKTYSMVRNPFSLLKPNWRAHADLHPARALAKKASNIWLEGQYGWKATYLDFKGIAQGLSKAFAANQHQTLEGMLERWSVSKRGTSSLSPDQYPLGGDRSEWNLYLNRQSYGGLDMLRVGDYRADWTATVGCRQRVAAVHNLARWQRICQEFGLDRFSILSTIWELIPFSFVVDWFIDPQSIWSPLSMARLAAPDISHLGCSTVLDETYRFEYIPLAFPPIFPWWVMSYRDYFEGDTPIIGSVGHSRTYTRSSGLPPLSQILTIFKSKGLNSTQLTSGTSLVVQQSNNLFESLRRLRTGRSR